jgi:hypothetical protein
MKNIFYNMEHEHYAVRWARHEFRNKLLGFRYTKWHWTEDETLTLCGARIPVGLDHGTFLPETEDDVEFVTCKRCLNKMKN